MKNYFLLSVFIGISCLSCMKDDSKTEEFEYAGKGVLISNEGNFGAANASLSYYFPDEKRIENAVFSRTNGIPVGEVLQSMTVNGNDIYLISNNSGVVFVINKNTLKLRGQIEDLISPRYVHFVNSEKAYISDLYGKKITVFNPKNLQVSKEIDVKHLSTEQMVQYQKFVFTNCWSGDNKILVIDTQNDAVVDSIEVGIQPCSILLDKNNKLWVLNDGGGWPENPAGYENSSLWRIDAGTRKVEKKFIFPEGSYFPSICLNGNADTLYFINNGLWCIPVNAETLPKNTIIPADGKSFYKVGIDPDNSEIYLSDAIDWVQNGVVYRYSPQLQPLDTIRAGIIPGGFCFKH